MLLVVQRVAGSGGEGYNGYYHVHGPALGWVWEVPEGVPDRLPGEQKAELIAVHGPARVRSFLDLAFPDEQESGEVVRWAHDAIVGLVNVGSRLPLSVASGPWLVRFEVERGLIAEWHDELHRLVNHMSALWIQTRADSMQKSL